MRENGHYGTCSDWGIFLEATVLPDTGGWGP